MFVKFVTCYDLLRQLGDRICREAVTFGDNLVGTKENFQQFITDAFDRSNETVLSKFANGEVLVDKTVLCHQEAL